MDYFTSEPMKYFAPSSTMTPEARRAKLEQMIDSGDYLFGLKTDGNWSRAVITAERQALQTRGISTVTKTYGFDPVKLDKHSNDIKEMISQLSSNFDECNQGYTFMDLPFKGDGNCKQQWGEQYNGNLLMALGIASGWMKLTLEDPELWKVLPGGVPYVYRTEKRQDMSSKITTVGEATKSA